VCVCVCVCVYSSVKICKTQGFSQFFSPLFVCVCVCVCVGVCVCVYCVCIMLHNEGLCVHVSVNEISFLVVLHVIF